MSDIPELWASVDDDGLRRLWTGKPQKDKCVLPNRWSSDWRNGAWCFASEHGLTRPLFDRMFPEGIAPGECKRITIERIKIVEETG